MDYEKKYKEALGWMQSLYNGLHGKTKEEAERYFPELKKSEDERIRKFLIEDIKDTLSSEDFRHYNTEHTKKLEEALAWFEKQGNKQQKTSIWKHWKDGIAGNGEGEPIYLIKYGRTYSLSSCLGFECDYIELSELDKLLSEKQGEQKPQRMISAEAKEAMYDKPVWSKEDEEELDNAVYACLHIYGKDSDSAVWLKSLKQRIEGE